MSQLLLSRKESPQVSAEKSPAELQSFTEEYLGLSAEEKERVYGIVDLAEAEEPIRALWSLMDANNDDTTKDHSHRVAIVAVTIGLRRGLGGDELTLLAQGALTHDGGKEHPDNPGIQDIVHSSVQFERGSKEQEKAMETIHRHPSDSVDLIEHSSWPPERKRQVGGIAGSHHRFSLYDSYGLEPDPDVAHLAEIVAAADMFDALASDRSYKKAYTREVTEKTLRVQFTGDQTIIEAALPHLSVARELATVAMSN